jgi:hypothetical protein
VVLMELVDSIGGQICRTLRQEIQAVTGQQWTYANLKARNDPADKEAYGFLWQTQNVNFAITDNASHVGNIMLSSLEFPASGSWADTGGRHAAVAVFRTTDTQHNFAVGVYHAPTDPNQSPKGVKQLSRTPELYSVNREGTQEDVTWRLIGADFNLNVMDTSFDYLTDRLPDNPPPAQDGEGAGMLPVLTRNDPDMYTHYLKKPPWQWPPETFWPTAEVAYRNAQLDNIFYSESQNLPAQGGVVDVVTQIMNFASPLRVIAQQFALVDQNGNDTFPLAEDIPGDLTRDLDHIYYAYLFYSKAISDHLPLIMIDTI